MPKDHNAGAELGIHVRTAYDDCRPLTRKDAGDSTADAAVVGSVVAAAAGVVAVVGTMFAKLKLDKFGEWHSFFQAI